MRVEELVYNFKDEISREPGGEHIKRCYSCGTCTAGCPVREVTDRYNPRRIIRMALLGMRGEVLSSDFIWLCSACYTCYERCPQDVRIPELMTALKNIAAREGHIPPPLLAQVDLLEEHGRLYEIGEFENQKRRGLGLPEIEENPQPIGRILGSVGTERPPAPSD
ncbi:MAG: 4Fe-4S dicluster domain-containing protein [Deltaproteobacteria bacterium]|nr:4Fe-4S dicluster domain-containing protein [Deltaproteobacteria bacterium]